MTPGGCWTELVRPPPLSDASSLGPRVPRAPLNFPSTKKLKYFNFFFSWCQSLYPGCWGCTVLHIYIYNCVYIYILYIYIIFFWLGLFLIQSYRMVASPSPKGCPISVLEHGMGAWYVSSRVGASRTQDGCALGEVKCHGCPAATPGEQGW